MLKIAGLRLGKTLLYIDSSPSERKVFVFSADSKVYPEFDEKYGYVGYL
jgi:hypothetical protein